MEKLSVSYVMVHNIPLTYRSCDLRNFFTQIVETGGFRCFHFRHRLEVQRAKGENAAIEMKKQSDGSSEVAERRGETCCAIAMVRSHRLEELLATYNKAFWVTRQGETLTTRCYLRKVIIAEDGVFSHQYLPPLEERQQRPRPVLTRSDLRQMIELRPPVALPAGNVGTPTSYILRQINSCNFPAQLIRKLGIEFPRTRAKGVYGSVPMDYGTSRQYEQATANSPNGIVDTKQNTRNEVATGNDSSSALRGDNLLPRSFVSRETTPNTVNSVISKETFKKPQKMLGSSESCQRVSRNNRPPPNLKSFLPTEEIPTFARTLKGHLICSTAEQPKRQTLPMNRDEDGRKVKGEDAHINEGSDREIMSDSDDCEEWDRHESLHNDVTTQERTKERLFEEEQEVVWEKGGSGLVFYTDAQLWDEAEGDFDAKTSDDWDIDTSIYYEDGAGDKDAKDFVSMEHFKRLRAGKHEEDDNRVGYFDKFTKGFGRRILEKQGWLEGRGVGKNSEGLSQPIGTDGQHPMDRSGFGYRGEKLERNPRMSKRRRERDDRDFEFSSVYDKRFAEGEDPGKHDRNARSQEPTLLKYRKVFVKTSGPASSASSFKLAERQLTQKQI